MRCGCHGCPKTTYRPSRQRVLLRETTHSKAHSEYFVRFIKISGFEVKEFASVWVCRNHQLLRINHKTTSSTNHLPTSLTSSYDVIQQQRRPTSRDRPTPDREVLPWTEAVQFRDEVSWAETHAPGRAVLIAQGCETIALIIMNLKQAVRC